MSPELTVFFAAMIPFTDLKLSIPLGMDLGLSMTSSMLFGVAGILVPSAIFLATVKPVAKYLREKSSFVDNFLTKLFAKTHKNHSKKHERYGAIFLVLLVAIPFPGSGPTTGAMAAYVLGIDHWKAFGLISLGAMLL